MGSVVEVKALGVFALIDEGELDWKVVTLNRKEAEEKKVYYVTHVFLVNRSTIWRILRRHTHIE